MEARSNPTLKLININKLMEWYGMQIKLSMLNENEKDAYEYVNGEGNHPPLACILT